MTRKEHLLTILAEECGETAQRATKALRFSLEEIQPGQSLTNKQRLIQEFNDIYAMMVMLRAEFHIGNFIDPELYNAKIAKVEHFLQRSRDNGTLTE